MSGKTKRFVIGIILVIAGIVSFVFGFTDMSHIKNFPETEAKVVSVEEDGSIVYVSYNIDGKEYQEILEDSPEDINKGDVITVRYNPKESTYVTAATKSYARKRLISAAVFLLAGLIDIAIIIIRGR